MVLRDDHINEFDDVGVLNLSQNDNLSEHPLAISGVLKNLLHSLNSDSLPRGQLYRLDHLSITALTQHLLQLVLHAYVPVGELLQRRGVSWASVSNFEARGTAVPLLRPLLFR